MFGRLFGRWLGGSRKSLPEDPSHLLALPGPIQGKELESKEMAPEQGSQGSLPEDRTGAPPTVPPGWTLREYLTHRIRDRSRWLAGRYVREKDGMDHGVFLESLRDTEAPALRRPPLAARRLLQENRQSDASLKKLAKIIETDPALLQSLLKHANSVFYSAGAGGNPVVAVPPALQRLGSKGIEIVVMSHMVEGTLCRPGEGLDELAGAVWAHMVRVAPLARYLAPDFKVDTDEAYALGLLHDVGKLVLFNRVADLRKNLRRPVRLHPGFMPAVLRELHEPIGSLAVLEWGLGEGAALAVALHHRNPPPVPPSPICEVVFLAEKLDLLAQAGTDANFQALWAQGALTAPREEVSVMWEVFRQGIKPAAAEASAA